ncbi:MAG: hypothetical protein R8G34_00895 [Paracoccaceae bacterium]|nr:hypothetical protein [Paracoccaceae bacterium]
MDTWCKQGKACIEVQRETLLTYLPEDGTATQDLGDQKQDAIVFKDKGRPRSRARSFLFQLDQGSTGLLTLFHSGGAAYSLQYEGSPAGGQMTFGSCTVGPMDQEL